MKFPYKRYTVASSTGSGDEEIYRPMAPLRVFGPLSDAYLWALLDTGADETVLPRSIGDAIGLTFGKPPAWTVGGIGGQAINVHSADVTMKITDWGADVRVERDHCVRGLRRSKGRSNNPRPRWLSRILSSVV